MSFIVRCPFCKTEMECPDDVFGQVGQCVSCGREIDLEPVDGSPVCASEAECTSSSPLAVARAAAVVSSTMPRVTWSWAFSFVWKISVAVAAIDGAVWFAIWLVLYLIDRHDAARRDEFFRNSFR